MFRGHSFFLVRTLACCYSFNPLALHTSCTWPCCFSCAVPHAVPCTSPHAPDAPILLTQVGHPSRAALPVPLPPVPSVKGRSGRWVGRGWSQTPHPPSEVSQAARYLSACLQSLHSHLLPGHREIHVIDTDYEQFAILRLSLHWQGKDYHVLKYFSKCTLGWEGGPAAALLGTAPPSPAPLCPPQLGAWRTSMGQASGDSGR